MEHGHGSLHCPGVEVNHQTRLCSQHRLLLADLCLPVRPTRQCHRTRLEPGSQTKGGETDPTPPTIKARACTHGDRAHEQHPCHPGEASSIQSSSRQDLSKTFAIPCCSSTEAAPACQGLALSDTGEAGPTCQDSSQGIPIPSTCKACCQEGCAADTAATGGPEEAQHVSVICTPSYLGLCWLDASYSMHHSRLPVPYM
jgi:hypothetical protein